jgi:hypothetical protein
MLYSLLVVVEVVEVVVVDRMVQNPLYCLKLILIVNEEFRLEVERFDD